MNDQLTQIVKQITHGVYVIGVSNKKHDNAFTAAWVMQTSFQPLLLAFSVNPEHYSYQLLQTSGICSINVLKQSQLAIAEHFGRSGFHRDKMTAYQWQRAKTGAPILIESSAYFDCVVNQIVDSGDHRLVICKVVDAGLLQMGQPMLYIETADMDGSSQRLPECL